MFSPKEYTQLLMEEKEIIQLDWFLWNNNSKLLESQPLAKLYINVGVKKNLS